MNREKKFDSVKMMRAIRDKMDKEITNMSNEEIKKYIKKRKQKFDQSQVSH